MSQVSHVTRHVSYVICEVSHLIFCYKVFEEGLKFTLLLRVKFMVQNSCVKFHVCSLHQAGKVKVVYQFLGGLIDQSCCFIFPGNQLFWLPSSFLEQSWGVMHSHTLTALSCNTEDCAQYI